MIINIQPTVDLAFRLMLGSPEHSAVTVHFLNSVLEHGPRIQHATILNPVLEKETTDDKLAILDIKAQDELGRFFNIEMQTSLAGSLQQRLLYYAGRLYCSQLREGMTYRQLCPAISICVLSKSLFPNYPRLHFDFLPRDRLGLVFTEELQLHLIELPKAKANVHNVADASPLERWSFFLLNAHRIDAEELRRLLPEPEFHEALGVLEMITHTPETRELYEARLKAKLDEESRLYDARDQGLSQGLSRGKWIGKIQILEELLKLTPTDSSMLETWDEAQLAKKSAELEQRLAATGQRPTV